MKALNWCTDKERHEYMRMRQSQNTKRSLNNRCENWMFGKLVETSYKWNRSAQWGYRIFDFWCAELGCAIEVDGPEHDEEYDAYRDEYNYRRSGIAVLRVRNWDENDALRAISILSKLGTWKERREKMGLNQSSRQARCMLVKQPYPPSLLYKFLEGLNFSN